MSVGPTGSAHTGRRNDTPPALQTKTNNKTRQVQCKRTRKRGREGGPRNKTRRGRSRAPCFRACGGVMQVPMQCPCPNIVHARCPKGSYMCPDTSAGTLAIAAAPAPHFVCAVQSALDRTSCRPNFMLALKTTYVALSRHNLPSYSMLALV